MDIQLWIIGQIAIDALLVGVLVWLIVAGNRRRIRDSEAQSRALQRSEEILAQMREIVHELDGNLEEKRELFSEVMLEAIEETGLANAIREGRQDEFVSEEQVLATLRGQA